MVATLLCSIAVRAEGATALPQMSTDLENPVFYTISNTRSTSGKYLYYAGDNVGLRDANDITLASLFYFTGTAEACYIHNAATTKKVASVTSWTDAGIEWTIGVTPYGDGTTGLCICPKGNTQSSEYWNEFTYNDAYTTYAANDAGSVFVIEPYTGTYPPEAPEVKPSISSLADADPTKCYTINTAGRGAWTVSADGTMFSSTGYEGFDIDPADTRQQFAILSLNDEDYYLYSVSAKKFIKQGRTLVAGIADAIEFVDASVVGEGRVMVYFKDFGGSYVNVNEREGLVINSWSTIDAGNAVLISEAGDFDAGEALAMLLTGEQMELEALKTQVKELVAAHAGNHSSVPAIGQYSTSAYEALAAVADDENLTKEELEEAIAAFEAAKCLPVFTIDGVYRYAAGMSIYENVDGSLLWKETDRTDESMLWVFDMNETVVGVTDKVVVKNLATRNLFWGASFVQVTETSEGIADDGLFLFYTEGVGYPVHADEGRKSVVRWNDQSANSASAWKFTFVGTTYEILDLPVGPETPSGPVTSLSDADPTKCYAVSTTTRGAWAVDAEGTVFSATGAMGLDVDAADAHQQFAILSANDEDYYLYSVSAGKFVKSDGSLVSFVGDAIEFADASSMGEGRVQVRFKDIAKGYINLNNYGQMTIDGWNTVDEGNAVLIAEAGDFDATEALAILADPEGARLTVLLAQAQELLAANANKHAAEPALGQYATDAYEDLAATVNSDSVSVAALEYFIAAFEASKCLPVFTIDGVNDYATGMSVYDGGGQFPNWKATDRTDESMLWVFDMTETTVGVTDKVVVKNYATGNLLMGADFIQVAETSENIADDGLFLIFCEEDTQFSVWASQSGIVVRAQEIFSASSTAAWKFTYAGTTYGIEDAPVVPEIPSDPVTSLSAADPTKCYTISTTTRGAWAVDDAGTHFSTTGVEGYEVDADDGRQQFAILSANGEDYYLYSVSAKKFVKRDRTLAVGVGDAIEFVDASSFEEGRVLVRFRDFINANINIGGDYQITIDRWSTVDAGNAVLIAEAGDFDAAEALAALADPEAAELAALVAQVQELVEANAANHAVEPALGQYSTVAYDALVAVANTDSASKASLEAAIAAFEAAKCLPVFTITGFDPDKSIYESTNYNGLYWKELDRTDETMLWVFYMADSIVGVTDRVVVKNLATGNYFGNGTFIQVTETEEEIADDGYFLIYYEGTGTPLCAYRNGQVMGGDAWSVMSDAAWKFTYVGTTYGANTPHRDALEVLLNRAKGYNPYSGSELGYYVEDFSYLLDAIAEAEALLLGEPSEAECEAMVAELSQAVEQFESSDRTFRLPEPGKVYRIVSALPAFYELQSVEKAITINASDNTLWWGDLCPDSLQQEFVFEPVLGDSGVHLSWNMDINLGNGTTVSETQYFYNLKNVATGLYASYNDSAKFHLDEQPCTVYLTCLGIGQFGLKFRIENEYGGGNIYTVHAGDHNEGVPSDSIGDYGGVFGISSGIVSWYGGLDTPSAWYIREYPVQTDTVPSLQLVGVTPDSETSQAWVRALTLSFNKEVYVWSLDFDVRGMNTGEEFYINSHHIGENSDGGFDLTLYLGDANDGWTKMITVPDTYTYTIPAGAIKSVDGEDLPETTITFTVDGTFPVVSYSPVETTSLEQIELTFDKVIEDMTIYYDWWICNEEGDAVAYVDWGSGRGSKTVTLGLNTPITTPGIYSLRIFAGAFTAANNMPNMPANLTFTVAEDTPAISTDYVMAAQDVKTRVQSQVTLPIEMDNAGEVTAFQFDLYLPEGVAVSYTTEDGEVLYDIELNDDRAKSSHILAAEPQANGSLRIVAYSTSNAAFAGNSGLLVNVGLSVDDIAEGDYQIVMRNIRMVTTDETEKFGADCTVTLTVENLLLGDVNNDGEFSMLDVVMMVNAVLEIEQTNFNAAAADLNGDGVISMVDVVGVLRLVLTGGEAMAPARAARGAEVMPELSAGEFAIMGNGRVMLPVALNNREAYSAFQLDVVLPVGVELAEATLTGRAKASHTIAWNTLADGSVRVVAYAMDNAAFRDNEGALLNLVLNTSDALSADAMLAVTDGLFATMGGTEHRAADLDVMMRSHTTNVDEAYAVGFQVYGVKGAIEVACGAETVLSIYAVNGKLVQQVVANAGKTRIELPAGVYVVNGDKIIVK